MAVAPHDRLVASASADKTIKLWNTSDLSLVHVLRGHKRGVWSIEFSSVDKVIASASGTPPGTALLSFEWEHNCHIQTHMHTRVCRSLIVALLCSSPLRPQEIALSACGLWWTARA